MSSFLSAWWMSFRSFFWSATIFFTISYLTSKPLFDFVDYAFAGSTKGISYLVGLSIFLAAFLKTLFLVSLVFPGITILVVAFSDMAPHPLEAIKYAIIVWLGIQTGCALNYALGISLSGPIGSTRAAEYLTRVRGLSERFGFMAIFICSFHPNLIGDFFVLQGVLGLPFLRAFLLQGLTTSVALYAVIRLLPFLVGGAEYGGISASNHYIYISLAILGFGVVYATLRALSQPKTD